MAFQIAKLIFSPPHLGHRNTDVCKNPVVSYVKYCMVWTYFLVDRTVFEMNGDNNYIQVAQDCYGYLFTVSN